MVQDIIAGEEIAVADKVEGSENDLNAGEEPPCKRKVDQRDGPVAI